MQEESSELIQASLLERTQAIFQDSSDKLMGCLDELTPQSAKDALHHLRLQQVAFEVLNEELQPRLLTVNLPCVFVGVQSRTLTESRFAFKSGINVGRQNI
jgi:hypothetical protein